MLLSAIALITAFYACQDEESLTPNPSFTGEVPEKGGNGGQGGNANSDQYMIATIENQTVNFPISEVDTFGFFGSEWELNGEFDLFSLDPNARKRFSFEIYEDDWVVKEDTTYMLDSSNSYIYATYSSNSLSIDDSSLYFSDGGQIRFTLATPSGYEGTFNFTATNADDSRTISITNGRFKAVIDQDSI